MNLLMHLFAFVILNSLLVVCGFFLVKNSWLLASWAMFIIAIIAVYLIFISCNPALKMLAIIAITFTGMKAIAACGTYRERPFKLSFVQWTAFSSCWFGMRANLFETLKSRELPGGWNMIRFGISRLIIGTLLIFAARLIALVPIDIRFSYIIVSIILLVAFSLILHFGLLNISSGMWRLFGVNTGLLFREPAKADSLTNFWSRRWNLAFSEMTSVAIFRPIKSRFGIAIATMASFIFSGFLHELALSLPVNSGYGLPTLYFTLQGVVVLWERSLLRNNSIILRHRIFSKLWVLFWLVIPAPLLFHTQFLRSVIWPLANLQPFHR